MPDGYVVSVGVKADFADLKTQSAEGGAAVEQMAEQIVESTAPATAAVEQLGAAHSHAVPQVAAASGALRELEGHMPIRAAERFLTTTLGLGPALTAAFPLVGAIAMSGMLIEMGGRLVKFGSDAVQLGRELGTGWLTGAIGQLDDLASTVKQADEEIDRLNKDLDQTRQRGQEAALEHIRLTQGPAAAYRAEAQNATDREKKNEGELNNLLRERANLEAKAKPESVTLAGGKVLELRTTQDNLKAAKELEVVNKQIADYQATDNNLLAEAANLELQAQQVKEKKTKEPKEQDDTSEVDRYLEEQQKRAAREAEDEKKLHGDMVMQMVRDNEIAARENERIDDEVAANWSKGQEEEIRQAEKAEREKEEVERKYQEALARSAEQMQRAYEQGFKQVEGPLNAFADHWLQSGQRMGAAFQRMYDQMAMSAINALLRIGERWAAHELLITAAHIAGIATRRGADTVADGQLFSQLAIRLIRWIMTELGMTSAHVSANATKAGSDMATAATSAAITSATNVAQVSSFTAVAAMGAAASQAGIPIVGPELAAAAATVMTGMGAGYAALAAFENGADYIPRTGIAMLHQGEAVATRGENSRISQLIAMNQSGGPPSGVHFHDHSNFTGIDGASVAGMARQHGAQFRRETMRQLRLMNKV